MSQGPLSGVAVLGMHRSGTSALAGALRYLGLQAPHEYYLLPPHPDNPRGYFENRLLVELNEQVLAALQGEWSAPPSMDAGWEEQTELRPLGKRARALFRATMPAEAWFWKDPRLCLTLPFWTSVLQTPMAVMLIHRDPIEVAHSLGRRNGFSLHLGLALWERYMRDALRHSEGRPMILVPFRSVLQDPVASMRRIHADLEGMGVSVGHTDEDALARFISPSLPSADTQPTAENDLPSRQQRELMNLLDSLEHAYTTFPALELSAPTGWGRSILEERRNLLVPYRRVAEGSRWLRKERRRTQRNHHRLRRAHRELEEEYERLREAYQREVEAWPRWLRIARDARGKLRRSRSPL